MNCDEIIIEKKNLPLLCKQKCSETVTINIEKLNPFILIDENKLNDVSLEYCTESLVNNVHIVFK
jgi:hypothetical protein